MEKLLPLNIEAEQGVLGSIIIDPAAIDLVADFLASEDFYREAHRTIYDTMHALYERREACDFITLCNELERKNKLADVGGASYITSLINQVPTSGNIDYYGRIVEQKAVYRRLIHAAGQIAANAYEEDSEALPKAEEIIYKISQGRKETHVSSIAEVLSRYQNKLDAIYESRRRGVVMGVPTGFHDFDRMTGGLQKSDLILLAARPGTGKTSWALNAGYTSVEHGFSTLIFSLEMSEEQLAQRMVAGKTGIDQSFLRMGRIETEDDWDRIVEAFDALSTGPLWIDDTSGISLLEMRSRARRIQSEHGLDLIIVDYLQLMGTGSEKHENRVQAVSALSRGLKGLARELHVPVVALAQLSRAVEQRQDKVPQLSDLRESGTLEQDADIVAFIHCQQDATNLEAKMKAKPYLVDLIVAKHRNGPMGVVELQFEPKLTQFRNVVEGRPQ